MVNIPTTMFFNRISVDPTAVFRIVVSVAVVTPWRTIVAIPIRAAITRIAGVVMPVAAVTAVMSAPVMAAMVYYPRVAGTDAYPE